MTSRKIPKVLLNIKKNLMLYVVALMVFGILTPLIFAMDRGNYSSDESVLDTSENTMPPTPTYELVSSEDAYSIGAEEYGDQDGDTLIPDATMKRDYLEGNVNMYTSGSESTIKQFSTINLSYSRFEPVDQNADLKSTLNSYIQGRRDNSSYNFRYQNYYLVEFEEKNSIRRFGFFSVNTDIPDMRLQSTQYFVVLQDLNNSNLYLCDATQSFALSYQCHFDSILSSQEIADYTSNIADQPYKLPWRRGELYRVSQDKTNNFSHDDPYNYHSLDFAMHEGAELVASRSGTVVSAYDGSNRGAVDFFHCSQWITYTNYLVINHGDGTSSFYAHLQFDSLKVEVGDYVSQGQLIANVGSTGCSSGPHLHFSIQKEVDKNYGNSSGGYLRRTVPFSFSDTNVISTDQFGNVFYPNFYQSDNGYYRFFKDQRVLNLVSNLNTRGSISDSTSACGSANYQATLGQEGTILSSTPILCSGLLRWQVQWDGGVSGWVAQNDTVQNLLWYSPNQLYPVADTGCNDYTFDSYCGSFFKGINLGKPEQSVLRTDFDQLEFDFGNSNISNELGNTNYSAIFRGREDLSEGEYIIRASTGGGVKVFVGQTYDKTNQVINQWDNNSQNEFESKPLELSGEVWVRVEYAHTSGNSNLSFSFIPYSDPVPTDPSVGIRSESSSIFEDQTTPVSYDLFQIQNSDIQSIVWKVDGVEQFGATSEVFEFSDSVAGTYSVSVEIVDNDSNLYTDSTTIEVLEPEYVAAQSNYAGLSVEYNSAKAKLRVVGQIQSPSDCRTDELRTYYLKQKVDETGYYFIRTPFLQSEQTHFYCGMGLESIEIDETYSMTLTQEEIDSITTLIWSS